MVLRDVVEPWPNCGVDITHVVDQKRAAIECYQSQLTMPYVDATLGLNRYRGLKLGVDFAEALFVCRLPRYRALCRKALEATPSLFA